MEWFQWIAKVQIRHIAQLNDSQVILNESISDVLYAVGCACLLFLSSWSLQYSKARSLCGFQRSSNRTTIISILHLGLAQLSFYTFCGFCLSRILLYFPMSVRQLVRPSAGVTSPLYDVRPYKPYIF